MKVSTPFILFFIISFSCIGQEKALKLIEKGKYEQASEYLIKNLKDKPNDIILNYANSKLYNIPAYKEFNTDSAYSCIYKTEKIYYGLDSKSRQKIYDIVNENGIKLLKTQICFNAFNIAKRINSKEGYEKFIVYYNC